MLIKLLILLFVSTNVWSADPPPTLYDEGTKQGVIFNFNCTGDGITCSRSGITGTLNVAASGSGGVGVGTVSPGVINRIAYYPGTTNVTLDDLAALTTDGTNIGIGTTGPRQKLEVNGSQYASGNVGIGTSAVSAAAPLEITRLGTTTSLMISSPGQDGDLLKFDGNGNLGIGTTTTTSPTKLMVNGSSLFSNTMTLSVAPDTNADNFIFKKQGAVSASNIQFSNSHRSNNTDFWLYGYDGSTFKNFSGYFYDTHKVLFGPSGTGANTLVADLANSNVGVGTVNPVNKLEVVGTAQVDGFKLDTNPSAGYVLVSGSTGIGTWMSATTVPTSITLTTTGTSGASTLTGNVLNIPQYTGGAGTNYWTSSAGTGNVGISTVTNSVGIGTFMGQGALVVLPPQDGKLNVGIGTWNPITALEVIGTAKATALRATGISGSTQCVQADTNGNLTGTGSACGGSGSTPGGGLNAVQYNSPVGTFAGSEAVLSMNGTNVGIGTTNGRQLLEVNGRSWFQNNVGIGTLAPSNSGLAMLHIVQSNTASGANGAVALRVDDTDAPDQSPFAVTDAGYVGIGTFKPTARLHIKGSTDAGLTQETTDDSLSTMMHVDSDNNQANDYNSIEFRRNGTSTTSWVVGSNGANSGNFNIRYGTSDMSGGSAAFVINSSGNVGMGLTNSNPAAILDISTTANQNLFVVEDNGDADTTPFLIDATGNVGIGTTSTQTKVAILGGNVGIGTWTATNASLETTGLRVFNQGEAAGRVLVSNSLGIGTWMTASSIGAGGSGTNYWSLSAGTGNVGINTTQSVGIGTTLSNNGALVVMPVQSGAANVGIGTFNPTGALEVKGSGVNTFSTNVGIGTTVGVPNPLYVVGTPMFTTGLNIGIGTASPTRLCIANNAIAVCP